MKDWPLIALGEIFDIARGGSPRPIDSFYTDDPNGVNWIMIGDASEGSKYITGTKRRIKAGGVSRSRPVKPGDFLLTNSMSFGHPYILKTAGCIHDGWLVLSCLRQDVDQDYFYHLLGSPTVYSEFERRAAGATVKNLNIDLVKGVEIPLPPLPEQRRIAAILDRADAIRVKRRQTLVTLNNLPEAIFSEMFSGRGGISALAQGEQLGKHLSFLTSGGRGWAEFYTPSGQRFIRSLDVRMNSIGDENVVFVTPPDSAEARRTKVAAGDVLLTITGSLIGRVSAVPDELAGSYISQHVAILRPKSSILPRFLSFYMSLEGGGQKQIAKVQYGQTKPGLNFEQIRDFKVPTPPMALQSRFVTQMHDIETLASRQRAHLAQLDTLFTSLQHRAFRGELTSKSAERELAEAV